LCRHSNLHHQAVVNFRDQSASETRREQQLYEHRNSEVCNNHLYEVMAPTNQHLSPVSSSNKSYDCLVKSNRLPLPSPAKNQIQQELSSQTVDYYLFTSPDYEYDNNRNITHVGRSVDQNVSETSSEANSLYDNDSSSEVFNLPPNRDSKLSNQYEPMKSMSVSNVGPRSFSELSYKISLRRHRSEEQSMLTCIDRETRV